MKRKRGYGTKSKQMVGGQTWNEWLKENKVLSTLAGTAGTVASFIPGVNALVSPALAGVAGALSLGGYGHRKRDRMYRMKGGAVFTGGQVPIHKMTGAGVRGGNSVYNNVGSSYGSIRV